MTKTKRAKTRLSNGRYATKKQSLKEKMIAPILMVEITLLTFGFKLGCDIYNFYNPEPVQAIEIVQEEPIVEEYRPREVKILYSGKVSFYSWDGCLGCNANQIMGNGHKFDENANTIAIPCEDILSKKHKYGEQVLVINQDNLRQEKATITDCGGFSKYGRVADLSKGLMTKLDAKTDQSEIVIYKYAD